VSKARKTPKVLGSEELRDIARFFEEAAREAVPHANKKDCADLIRAASLLTEEYGSVESLITIIETYERATLWIAEAWNDLTPEDQAKLTKLGPLIPGGLIHVSGLLWAVATIRDLALGTGEARLQLDAIRRAHTAPATDAKRAKSAWIDVVIQKHAEPLSSKYPSWTAGRIADQIAAAVNKELKNKEPECTLEADAIRKRLRRINSGRSFVRG
jgi:hypothetical protein